MAIDTVTVPLAHADRTGSLWWAGTELLPALVWTGPLALAVAAVLRRAVGDRG